MLGNNEKIEGVELKAVFAKMLSEVQWEQLKTYILSNAQLSRVCTAGGFRLEPKHRARIEGNILRDVEKSNFSELQCNGVFASWYPVHVELHKSLEDYFHSDEYKAYREANGVAEDEYVLNQEKFEQFYNVQEFEAWRILLCFSPLKFSKEQAALILEDKKNDSDIMSRLTEAENRAAEQEKRVAQLTAEMERFRSREQANLQEIQELRKQNRQLKIDDEQLQKRVESAVSEMKRSNQQLAQADAVAAQREEAVRVEMGRSLQRMQNDSERAAKEIAQWQARYEEQVTQGKGYLERAEASEKRAAEAMQAYTSIEKRISETQRLVDVLLSRIDWLHVGASMKLSPTMKRNFNSLVKQLDYDESRNLTLEGTFGAFWEALFAKEKTLVDAISQSSERELINGSIKEYWKNLAGDISDVMTSLEARMSMLGILQDIFFQNYTDEDLQKKELAPKSLTTEKAEKEPKAKKEPKTAAKKVAAPKAEKKTATKTTAKKTTAKKTKSSEE